jgi:hypothetical protein
MAMSIFLFDDLPVDLHLEVGLHVVDVDAVLVEERASDALANALLVVLGDRLARDVVEDLAVLDGACLVVSRPLDGPQLAQHRRFEFGGGGLAKPETRRAPWCPAAGPSSGSGARSTWWCETETVRERHGRRPDL